MNEYSQGRFASQATPRADSPRIPIASAGNAAKGLNFLPLAPGLFGAYLAYALYPVLDGYIPLIVAVFLLFVIVGAMPRTSVASGVVLAVLAAALLLNGALDRVPPTEQKTTVIRKAMVPGDLRRGTHYQVFVSSWRAGRSQEELEVDWGVFRRATAGGTVTVELHKGFLGLPWLGKISAD